MLDKSRASCRKLASRARERIDKDAVTHKPDKDAHTEIVTAFFDAVKNGDMRALVSQLKENVILHADGGGKAPAALKLLTGADTVATFLLNVVSPRWNTDSVDVQVTHTWFNGSPGFVIRENAKPVSAFNLQIEDGLVKKIHALRNPDKLKFFDLDSSAQETKIL